MMDGQWKLRNPFVATKRTRITAKTTYGLTPLGRTKAEDFKESGAKGEVLATLATDGASNISEISASARISTERVKRIIETLISEGKVQPVSEE